MDISQLSSKQSLLMTTLYKFYENTGNTDKLLDVISGQNNVSLRIIDWFVTNYSKKNNIIYSFKKIVNKQENCVNFSVHLSYKNQLKAYSKKQFDPFCRRERINFYYKESSFITTTVGQLNFFRWLIENDIIDFIYKNINIIEKDMNENINKHYKSKKIRSRRKRTELSVSATKSLNKHKLNIVLDFN
jgi:hypothetical protein